MDIYDLDVDRLLNRVYVSLVEDAGPLSDRAEVRAHIDGVLDRAASGDKGSKRRTSGKMTPARAAKMAADMADYDAKAAKGRV